MFKKKRFQYYLACSPHCNCPIAPECSSHLAVFFQDTVRVSVLHLIVMSELSLNLNSLSAFFFFSFTTLMLLKIPGQFC